MATNVPKYPKIPIHASRLDIIYIGSKLTALLFEAISNRVGENTINYISLGMTLMKIIKDKHNAELQKKPPPDFYIKLAPKTVNSY